MAKVSLLLTLLLFISSFFAFFSYLKKKSFLIKEKILKLKELFYSLFKFIISLKIAFKSCPKKKRIEKISLKKNNPISFFLYIKFVAFLIPRFIST